MRIRIRARGAPVPERLRAHVERRIEFALARFGDRVTLVVARLSDVGGRRGVADRHCAIEVTLRPRSVYAEGSDPDAFAAINHASAQAAHSVARAIAREPAVDAARTGPRGPGPPRRK
jgi:ribosomal subunit interface protein